MARASSRTMRPTGESAPLRSLSNSGAPISSSSCFKVIDTADGVRPIWSAAARTPPVSQTATKLRMPVRLMVLVTVKLA